MGIINTLSFITHHPLNKQRKLKAVGRWLSWQIGSRLVPGPVAVKFVNDTMLLVAPGMTGATGNVYAGLHEFQDMAFVLHLLRQGDVFVDIGANVGAYTVLAGGVGAKCISIEPSENAFAHLLLNLHLNGIRDQVDARNIGVGSKRGTVKFTDGLDTVNHVVADSEAPCMASCNIEADTLDNIVAESQPVLLKIDVEGFETEVIAGAQEVLSKESLLAVIMELNGSGQRYGFDEGELFKRMIKYDFTPYSYVPFERSLQVLSETNKREGNTLFIKDLKSVIQRLETAPAFNVSGEHI